MVIRGASTMDASRLSGPTHRVALLRAMAEQHGARAAVVTVSDGVSRGAREDLSGRAVAALLEGAGFAVERREVVPDERDAIRSLLQGLCEAGIALVATTGGTGLGRRDVTPEATRDVIEREAPGLAEEMRAAGRASTPFAALSRGVAGSRGSTLILNLPGSENGASESLRAVIPALPHAVRLLAGDTVHGPGGDRSTSTGHRHREAEKASVREEAAAPPTGEDRVTATAVSVRGDPPCRVGQKLVLGSSGPLEGTLGCAEFDAAAVADYPSVAASGIPVTKTYAHELGTIDVYLEPSARRPLLVVFSATPVGTHLAQWASEVGFDAVIVEPRGNPAAYGDRTMGFVRSLDEVDVTADTFAVHTDHDAPGVAESVAALLRSPVRFIGVMGSTRHVGPHLERLRQMGFPEEDLARIHTPVGLDIGARSAPEIALSILAGLVAERHGARGGWLDRRGR